MAKRAGESMTAQNGKSASEKTEAIRSDIERTRGDMSRTVNEIEERLSPAHIKEQVASVAAGVTENIEHKVAELKESVLGGYHEVKDHVKDDLRGEISDVKHKVTDEFTHARHMVRDATVGRMEHMVHDARETVTDAGTSVLDTIKANPIPAALIGVGLGWLIFSGRSNKSDAAEMRMRRYRRDNYGYGAGYGYAEGRGEYRGNMSGDDVGGPRRVLRDGQRMASSAMHAAGDGVSNVGHRVQDGASHLVEGAQGAVRGAAGTVGHLAEDVGHRAADLAHGARDAAVHFADDARVRGRRVVRGAGRQIMRAERTVESTMRENPLALGAVAIAIGAAIGLSLPHTEIEDEWMGETKERLIHKAEDFAGTAIQQAETAVGQLAQGQANGSEKAPDTKNGLGNGLAGGSKSHAV